MRLTRCDTQSAAQSTETLQNPAFPDKVLNDTRFAKVPGFGLG
jgi:hypothetical protein